MIPLFPAYSAVALQVHQRILETMPPDMAKQWVAMLFLENNWTVRGFWEGRLTLCSFTSVNGKWTYVYLSEQPPAPAQEK